MMHCKRCGGAVNETDRYCRGCNADLTKIGTIEPSVFNDNINKAAGASSPQAANTAGEPKKENSVWDQILSEKAKESGSGLWNNQAPSSTSTSTATATATNSSSNESKPAPQSAENNVFEAKKPSQTNNTNSDIFDTPLKTPNFANNIQNQAAQGSTSNTYGSNAAKSTEPVKNSSWEIQEKMVVPPPQPKKKSLPIIPIIAGVAVVAAIVFFVFFKGNDENAPQMPDTEVSTETTTTTTTDTSNEAPATETADAGMDKEGLINFIRDARYDSFQEKTVGEAFDSFFTNQKWDVIQEGNLQIVIFTGNYDSNGVTESAEFKFEVYLERERFDTANIIFGGKQVASISELEEVLSIIYGQ